MGQRGIFFFSFLCVSEHFVLIETHILFFKYLCERKAQNAHEQSEQDASANMLRQTVTLATAIFLFCLKANESTIDDDLSFSKMDQMQKEHKSFRNKKHS